MRWNLSDKWLSIYDDVLDLDGVIDLNSQSIPQDELIRSLVALARLKVFIFSMPRDQARAAMLSKEYANLQKEVFGELEERWADLEFGPYL